jgi:hypothetical protein
MLTDFVADEMKRDYGTNGNKRNKRKNSNLDLFRLFRNLSSFHQPQNPLA